MGLEYPTICRLHLVSELSRLTVRLRAAVDAQAGEAAGLDRPDLADRCITDRHAQLLLRRAADLAAAGEVRGNSGAAARPVSGAERELGSHAALVGRQLPLAWLAQRFGLAADERFALVICAAAELDRSFSSLYAYLHDDARLDHASAELLLLLTAPDPHSRLAERARFGPYGRLRASGLVVAAAEGTIDLRRPLRLGAGVLEFLLGTASNADLLGAPGLAGATHSATAKLPPHVDAERVTAIGDALADGRVAVLGVWGAPDSGQREVVAAVARRAGLRLQQLRMAELPDEVAPTRHALRDELLAADVQRTLLWVDCDDEDRPVREALRPVLARMLVQGAGPVVLTGSSPWRPTDLVAARGFAEITIPRPDYAARQAMWAAAVPELGAGKAAELASRYRMAPYDVRAVAAVTRTGAALNGNGASQDVSAAVAAIARKRTERFATVVEPHRRLDDLVLPGEQHRQIREIAQFYAHWPHVADEWGFARHASLGIKALFTGDPGTGKTLAAEVIAGTLGLALLKVDLARVVSKWIGETEKNLEAAFDEAERGDAILFFDEADALFGKRGEVRHGTDRYANLEVGYLLQRLESYDGLAVLASNLEENIDEAFTRRFQFVVHFPRPGPAERRRIWDLALPPATPRAAGVDLDSLVHLEMSGASIVAAARTAALLAAARGATVGMHHLVHGIARQFAQEARVLRLQALGRYAELLEAPLDGTGA